MRKYYSDSSQSEGDDDNVDHTYNPYSFKRLENAIFKAKKPVQ
jgi:hypothetical protein